MRSDIVPGGLFPDYELRDHSGTRRKLSGLQGADPMVLVLSRGAFCPKDRQQHQLLVEMEPELKVAYTKIVTISTDAMMEANEMRDGYWYWGRPSPAQLRADLRAVTEKVRPDWDITAPGQLDAWARGDKSAFWPYGMSLQEVFAADPSAD